MKGKGHSCKVNYALLAIAYLEVLIWTTCLLSSCATTSPLSEDTGYILRETGNLAIAQGKQAEFDFEQDCQRTPAAIAADLKEADLAHHAERLVLQRFQDSQFLGRPAAEQESQSFLQLFPALKGAPAPYTGVKAIT